MHITLSRDGEEYGLLGSTWYGEKFADELSKKAVAYLNVDVGTVISPWLRALRQQLTLVGPPDCAAVAGSYFTAGATPSLRSLIRDVVNAVNVPGTNQSVATRWDGSISTLGSGSGTNSRLRAI